MLVSSLASIAQENTLYQKPSAEILALADYDRAPSVMLNSKRTWVVFTYRNTYKSLLDLNQEELRLGGLRINPKTMISSTVTYVNNLKIKRVGEKSEREISGLPAEAQLANFTWSPDEKFIAFSNSYETGLELWVLELETAKAWKVSDVKLNAAVGNPIQWFANSKDLLLRTIPANQPAIVNNETSIPLGPIVSSSEGQSSQNRTYQDLLKNKSDEQNFENLITSELIRIDLGGVMEEFMPKAMYIDESFSPDGKLLMVTVLRKPFSYIVPYYRFPQTTTIHDLSGALVKIANDVPLSEIMPKGFMATRTGKRNMSWRADEAATLYYVEALDGGDPNTEATFRDEVFVWKAPFADKPTSIFKTNLRFNRIYWGTDQVAVAMEYWYDTRMLKTSLFNPGDALQKAVVLSERNYQDIYSDPGTFAQKKNEFGRYVLDLYGDKAILMGDGFTEKGQFPFIDELDLKTLKTKRLYTSKYTDKKEDIFSILDYKKGTFLVSLQAKTMYPNYYIKSFKSKEELALTSFKNPFESLKNVHKEVITYTREDGVTLSGTLYLPANYDRKAKKEKLPLLIWAYPQEFKDKQSAGQNNQNPNEFIFPYYGSFVYWVTKGYAVLDDAAFPIVGEGAEEPNDTFIPQLVANAKAAIDAVDSLGYIDRTKVAIGGHSYGAFMTANLLTHTNLFACGIARSGAYNRTLTPFGFQSEQRNYWDVPAVYNTMSPFMNAEKMKTPLLLVHGEADNNPGTFTLQSERYFQALKGLGAPVRLVILPKESHGYVAKENILHLLWEQDQFLEKYLKK